MSAGHILVVDDEPSMRRYLQTVLELDSYRVTTAANGDEALEQVQKWSPDLVLLDMVMPLARRLGDLAAHSGSTALHEGRDVVVRS